jgi:diguanylate cyclase (GGDEF)-like protein
VRLATGEIKWIQNQASPELAENGDVYWDGLIIDISDRKQAEAVLSDYRVHLEQQVQERTIALQEANQELERLATLDGLTQVSNRRRFDLYLTQEWQRLARDQQILSLILCDVDYFKRYNDCYGHQAGDYCLQIVARAMKGVIKRPADLLARYGGEEFAVILPQTNRWGAMQVAETLRQAILDAEIPHADSNVSDYVTLSVGVATVLPSQLNSIEELIADADRALYQAKQMGRDRICFAEPSASGNVQW